MSELREKITAEGRRIWAYAESGATEKYPVPKGPSIDAATDRILELMRTALLSEQAVENAAVTLAAFDGLNWCFDGETSNPYFRQDVLKRYRERARAALAAAGITKPTTD